MFQLQYTLLFMLASVKNHNQLEDIVQLQNNLHLHNFYAWAYKKLVPEKEARILDLLKFFLLLSIINAFVLKIKIFKIVFCFQRNSCECLIEAEEIVQGQISGILWIASGGYQGSWNKMSWMSGLGWKEGLSGIQLKKVEELEKNLSKANNNVNQKQVLIDGLNQSMEKLKRKVRFNQILNLSIQKLSMTLQRDNVLLRVNGRIIPTQ